MDKKTKSLLDRGAVTFGDSRYFSRTMPKMTDEDWERLAASQRERAERWEAEKARDRETMDRALLGRE